MQRLQCVKCEQIFWMGFDPGEEGVFVRGDWVYCTCPKCGGEWTSVMGSKGARRRRKALRSKVGRKSVEKAARGGRKLRKRGKKAIKPEIQATG